MFGNGDKHKLLQTQESHFDTAICLVKIQKSLVNNKTYKFLSMPRNLTNFEVMCATQDI